MTTQPRITLIAAMAHHRVIGYNNQMPWHLPADLRHFKDCTLGKPVIMGRKTFDSIGKALPGRPNIIISRDPTLSREQCQIAHSIDEALALVTTAPEVMIIGGANLYAQMLPLASQLYLTFIDHEFVGDTFFPQWEASEWQIINREDFLKDEKNPYDYSFVTLERVPQ